MVATQASAYEVLAFADERAIPAAAVLVGEQDKRTVRGNPGRAARFLQQHQRKQTDRLGLIGHQFDQQPTEADRLLAEARRGSAHPPTTRRTPR